MAAEEGSVHHSKSDLKLPRRGPRRHFWIWNKKEEKEKIKDSSLWTQRHGVLRLEWSLGSAEQLWFGGGSAGKLYVSELTSHVQRWQRKLCSGTAVGGSWTNWARMGIEIRSEARNDKMKRATTTAKPSRQVKVLDVFCMADHQQFKGTSRSLLITTIQPYRRYRHRCVVCRVRSVFEYFDASSPSTSQIVLMLLAGAGVCCGVFFVAFWNVLIQSGLLGWPPEALARHSDFRGL